MIRHKSQKRNALWGVGMVGSALLAALALVGCGGSGGGGGVVLDSVLDGAHEVPPVTTTATGRASVTLNPDNGTIQVSLTTTGLNDVTEAHIHHGPPGADGPVMFTLYDQANGPFTSPLVKTLTAADFTPVPGVATFTDALGVIRGGAAYINVHTATHLDGEIRGQINP
jgi:hypothetical protein